MSSVPKWKKKQKLPRNEIKQNIQGINNVGKETGTQSNDLEQEEEINIQPEQNEEIEFKKWGEA